MEKLKLPDVSYSSWQLFENQCEWRWKIHYVDDKKVQNRGVYMDFGTALHGVIELTHARNPLIVDVDVAVFLFKKAFEWLVQDHRAEYRARDVEKLPELYPQMLEAGERILRRFDECGELASAEVVYNEYRIKQPIDRTDDVDVCFKGFIDMVIKTKSPRGETILYVCDFKTCSFGWDQEKRRDKTLQFQILLYKHFLCKEYGLDPKLVRTAFVLLKRSPPRDKKTMQHACPVEFFPISAGPISVQRPLDRLNASVTRMASRVRNGGWRKNRSNCVSNFGDVCPFLNKPECTMDDMTPEARAKLLEAVKQ